MQKKLLNRLPALPIDLRNLCLDSHNLYLLQKASKKIYQLTKNNVEEAVQFCIKNAEQGNVKAKIILYDLANKNVPQALNILIRDAENKIDKA